MTLLLCNGLMFTSFHPSGIFPSCNDVLIVSTKSLGRKLCGPWDFEVLSCLLCFSTNSTVMLQFSKVVPSHLLLKGGITVVFSLLNTLTKNVQYISFLQSISHNFPIFIYWVPS